MSTYKFKLSINNKQLRSYYTDDGTAAEQLIAKLLNRSTKTLGFDIETGRLPRFIGDKKAGLDPYRSFPSLMQFYDGYDTCYMFDTKVLPLKMFRQVFKEKKLIAHNAIFDASHMAHAGFRHLKFDCSMIIYNMIRCADYATQEQEEKYLEDEWHTEEGDGQVLDWLGVGERRGASLRSVVGKLLGFEIDKELQTSDWTNRPLSREQLTYATADSWLTYEIGVILGKRLKELGLTDVYKLNRKAIPAIVRMMLTGCKIDEEAHTKHVKKWSRQKDHTQLKLLKIFGPRINLRSHQQMSNWLEKHLPLATQHMWPRSEKTGKLRTNAQTLDKFSRFSFVGTLLEYKTLDKMLSTYGQKLLDQINPVTGRLHTRFTLGYTATGRPSSREPNIQNMPRDVNIRSIFIADKGNILVSADYSQIELRVAAVLSNDRAMMRAFKKGVDIHRLTASEVSGKRIERVTGDDRQLAKSLNFGLIFGLGPPGLVEYAKWNYDVDLSKDQSYEVYTKFFKLFPGLKHWHKIQREKCKRLGFVETVLGKRRALLPHKVYTRAVNHPVQGTAAEMILQSAEHIDAFTENMPEFQTLLMCHDEHLAEVPIPMQKQAQQILEVQMVRAAVEILPQIVTNNLVNAIAGPNWAATKEK